MAEDFGREIAACPDCGERRTEFSVHVCINVGVNAAFAAMATDEDYRKEVQELTPSAPTESMEEIAKLANFILEEFPGEPSASESAVDVAIRLLRERASMLMQTKTREEALAEALEALRLNALAIYNAPTHELAIGAKGRTLYENIERARLALALPADAAESSDRPWDDFPKVADHLNTILAAKSQKGGKDGKST